MGPATFLDAAIGSRLIVRAGAQSSRLSGDSRQTSAKLAIAQGPWISLLVFLHCLSTRTLIENERFPLEADLSGDDVSLRE
jgi:hypothetical protein